MKIRFNPVRAFRDPATRPRAIIWSGLLLIAFVVLWAGGLIGTSFTWFCTDPCHKVHDDNTIAYEASTHSEISCMACHEPVGAGALLFTLKKIEVLPDLTATIFNTYEVPVNPTSALALEMPSEQCTQCHDLKLRKITPSAGIIIDHDVHAEKDITCTSCHNRIAHIEEGVKLVLSQQKHDNWMSMDACFRCHGREEGELEAPAECDACHTKGFDLVPASHDAKGWYAKFGDSSGHAKAAEEESASIEAAHERNAEHEGKEEHFESAAAETIASSEVNSCYTCHEAKFCSDCHKLAMPHPASFAEEHGTAGYASSAVCANCHARSAAEAKGTAFCNACHHPASTPGSPWVTQHPAAVKKDGATPCFECHEELQCSYCHVRGTTAGRKAMAESYRTKK